MKPLRILAFGAVLALAAAPAFGQAVLGAKSGLVNYVEGKVFLGDQALEMTPAQFPEVKENTVLRTEEGRAEVCLTPGVILRLGENSSFRMVTNRLIDTRLELLSGSAIVEATEIAKDTHVALVVKSATVDLPKSGLYRFDLEPARLRVYKGSADVQVAGQNLSVSGGKSISLGGNMAIAEKFDTDAGDSLDRWSRRRGETVAMANASAANRARQGGVSMNPCGSIYGRPGVITNLGSWGYNPWYGLITYIPCNGNIMSPYGYRYYSPQGVYQAFYAPRPIYNPSSGFPSAPSYPTMGSTSGGYSGTVAAAPSVSSSAPAAASTGSSAASVAGSSSVGSSAGGGGGRRN
jgi:hypothetical protein